MDGVGCARGNKYNCYFYQTVTSFCNTADRLATARRSLGQILSPNSEIDINYKGFIEAWRIKQDRQLAIAAKYLGLPVDKNALNATGGTRLRRRK